MKKLVIGGVINAVFSLAVGGGAAWGIMHFSHDSKKETKKATANEKKIDLKNSTFISMPEILVTLHDKDDKDRYMLVEIVLISDGKEKEKSDEINASQPLYQSIAVETLSSFSYEEMRNLHISEIKDLLLTKLKKGVAVRNLELPFEDILIKRVVYQ